MNKYYTTHDRYGVFVFPKNGVSFRIMDKNGSKGFFPWTMDDMNYICSNGKKFGVRITAKEAEKIIGRKTFRRLKNG